MQLFGDNSHLYTWMIEKAKEGDRRAQKAIYDALADKMFALCEEFDWVPVSMKNDWTTIYGEDVTYVPAAARLTLFPRRMRLPTGRSSAACTTRIRNGFSPDKLNATVHLLNLSNPKKERT